MKPASYRPYLTGALAGLVLVLSVLVSTKVLGKPKYLGTSTTYVRVAGLLEGAVAPAHVEANEYYQGKKVKVDWQMLLVLGVLIGAFLASRMDRSFLSESSPPIWSERFGPGTGVRAVGAFLGGVIALFGVRMAGGCPSGHGISGLSQLSVSGYLSMAGFMLGGIVTGRLLYGRTKGGAR